MFDLGFLHDFYNPQYDIKGWWLGEGGHDHGRAHESVESRNTFMFSLEHLEGATKKIKWKELSLWKLCLDPYLFGN